jgi:hypothetical protein
MPSGGLGGRMGGGASMSGGGVGGSAPPDAAPPAPDTSVPSNGLLQIPLTPGNQ